MDDYSTQITDTVNIHTQTLPNHYQFSNKTAEQISENKQQQKQQLHKQPKNKSIPCINL